ncbi:MAG: DUF6261 family protein [Prevotellaceae bacterium]|jgi:hypothetical protein|nr:DUF6261 family protein [Prevotellaceae bacterium]
MEIIKFRVAHLRNEEHFQLMTEFKKLLEAIGALVLNIEQLFAVFLVLFGKEDRAVEVFRKNDLTDDISAADALRDSIYKGFTLLVETHQYSPAPEKVEAAGNIRTVIDHYGDFRNKSYNEETASINNFVQDINARCADDINTLNAAEWIANLSASNQTFENLMTQRFDQEAGQEYINLRETRKEIDKVYNQIIDYINASIIVNGEAAYVDFVNKLNERISYYKNTLAQRKGRAAKKNENTPSASANANETAE